MEIKTALLCQFKDPEEYFASFHAHHARIFDWIFYIDHNSKKEYRALDLKNTKIYRTDIENFTKDLFLARVIQDIRINFDFNFLFILDIDEFLPQTGKLSFDEFLLGYLNSAVGTLYWRNGYPLLMAPLIDAPTIFATKQLGNTKKLFYNLKRLGSFFPKEGNHNADYSFLGQTRIQIRPHRQKESRSLLHLPIISKAQLYQKLHAYPNDDFRAKIDMPQDLEYFDLTPESLLNIVGNYRAKNHKKYSAQDFELVSIFDGLRDEIHHVNDKVHDLIYRKQPSVQQLTADEVSMLRRRGFGRTRKLLNQIRIADDYLIYNVKATISQKN